MAVPRSKHTKSRQGKGRMHQFLEKPALTLCPHCGKAVLQHTVCLNCGYYKGVEVIDILGKLSKKEKKKREKELGKKEEEEGEKPLTWQELSKK